MKGAVIQPSYIPWRGYFDQICKADVFVFYDNVQYDKHGWRNRNRIKTHQGLQWLTIPVLSGGNVVDQLLINQVRIDSRSKWNVKHWQTLQQSYRRTPYFDYYAPLLKEFYSREWENLSDFTIELTIALARELGIRHTQFVRSSSLQATASKTERLVNLLQQLNITHYYSGPSAKSYIEDELFERAKIKLEYMVYDYPEYPQLHPPYSPYVTVLDLMFMLGKQAGDYIWGNLHLFGQAQINDEFNTDLYKRENLRGNFEPAAIPA